MRLHRSYIACFIVAAASCGSKTTPGTTTGPTGPTGAPGPAAPSVTPITDEGGRTFQISQGVPGEPAVVGCADGQREAFVDAATFPNIAGCIGEWTETLSLRTAATGGACGDDRGPCTVPADACAPGWHMCSADGGIDEVSALSAEQCSTAGGGRFVAAISHCGSQEGCVINDPKTGTYACYEEGWCSEPICCGSDCEFGSCPSGIWAEQTKIAIGTDQGCGRIASSRARGLLCCKG